MLACRNIASRRLNVLHYYNMLCARTILLPQPIINPFYFLGQLPRESYDQATAAMPFSEPPRSQLRRPKRRQGRQACVLPSNLYSDTA